MNVCRNQIGKKRGNGIARILLQRLITAKKNEQMARFFCKRTNGSFYSRRVNSLAGVEQLANLAAKNRSVKIDQDLTTILKRFIESSILGAIWVLN